LAALFLISRWSAHSSAASQSSGSSAKQPVIVELFTSEGCSSCPPADELLKKLSEDQPFDNIQILALEEHVDYWNTLGWTDPFSSVEFSRRQEQYAVALPDGGVYTPQMVVDGRSQFIGNRTHEARDQVRWAAAHPKPLLLLTLLSSSNPHTRALQLRLGSDTGSPGVSPASAPAAPDSTQPQPVISREPGNLSSSASTPTALDLWIAVTEKNLSSSVTAGENSGHTLIHAPVVRLLHKEKSKITSAAFPLTITINLHNNWNPSNLTAIAFLENPKSHQIQAAGSSPL
jgi:hypothetical protein